MNVWDVATPSNYYSNSETCMVSSIRMYMYMYYYKFCLTVLDFSFE